MTYSRSIPSAHRRGTILVLVVAVLALLAVIGTVYIISARTERASAAASATTINLKWAESAVMSTITQKIGDWDYDSAGKVGGYDAATASFGTLAARYHDYPEIGNASFNIMKDSTTAGKQMRSEPWLALKLHVRTGGGSGAMGDFAGGFGDFSRLGEHFFDPTSGTYGLGLTNFEYTDNAFKMNVVYDQTSTDTADLDGQGSGGDAVNFDSVPNFNAENNYPDSYVYLLPFSDGSGIRYRYGIRILDTNHMANLNTGSVEDPLGVTDQKGTYFTSYHLAGFASNATTPSPGTSNLFSMSDYPANLPLLHATTGSTGMGRSGTATTNATFSSQNWQQVMMRIEKPQDGPGGLYNLALFDLSDELELRSYGEFGTPFHVRGGMNNSANYRMWPNTLSANPSGPTTDLVTGNPHRRMYTTYSYSRELRPYLDPVNPYVLPPSDGTPVPGSFTGFGNPPVSTRIWPTAPARVSANPLLPSADNDALYYIAMAASNIATAMEASGFSKTDTSPYVANFATYRTNVYQADPSANSPPAGGAFYLPNGPSFVDSQGLCIRSVGAGGIALYREFGGGNNVTSAGTKIFLGYAAQPFINEVAVMAHKETDPTTFTSAPVVKDSAVELFNPYNLALSLSDYEIVLHDGTNGTKTFSLSGCWIPANGYFVLYTGTDAGLSGVVDTANSQQKKDPNYVYDGNSISSVVLARKYQIRTSHAVAWAPVDEMYTRDKVGSPLVPDVSVLEEMTDHRYSIERLSGGVASLPWGAAYNMVSGLYTDNTSLGKVNPSTGSPSTPMWDRSANATPPYTGASNPGPRDIFANIGEFNQVMRMSHNFDPNVVKLDDPSTFSVLSDQLATAYNSPPAFYAGMQTAVGPGHFTNEFIEAQLHFDFYPDPAIYNTTPPSDPSNKTDMNSVRLLDYLAMVDRVSDTSVDVGTGKLDISKLRIPGLINVNTAYGDTLRGVPGFQVLESGSTGMAAKVIGSILSYRCRSDGARSSGGYPGQSFSGVPGLGIRSMAELMVPIVTTVGGTYQSMDDRDKAWASIYNLCTVRSDTFVVYGCLEAIKVNPRYVGVHNNMTDWYDRSSSSSTPNGIGTTDDPSNTTCKNLRVARIRWVGIVDRSFCNENRFLPDGVTLNPKFQLPKVVALKDLPK